RVKTLNQELAQFNVHLEEKVKERTKELKVANDHLNAVTESRRQLLANIAHELGTPVTLLHNYIQSVQGGLISVNDEYYHTLVVDKVKVLNRLIEDLFDLSLLESGEISFNLQPVKLFEFIQQTYDNCSFALQQNERKFSGLTIDDELERYMCHVDIDRMDQLFSNLISNAIKNTENITGKVTMEAALYQSNYVKISVSDNG